MNKTQKFIGLLAILPLALVALTPDLIGEAYATPHDGDAFEERWGSTSNAGIEEEHPDNREAASSENRLASLENLPKSQ